MQIGDKQPDPGATTTLPGPVVVVGSVNLDIVCEVDHLPAPGQTVLARRTRRNVGGKGSNQAVAAALAGAEVAFIGRVGADSSADQVRRALIAAGIDVTGLRTVDDADTGVAYIVVADDNIITVDSGANQRWATDLDPANQARIDNAAVVVCQLEIPLAVVTQTANLTRGRFVLNAAPALPVDDQVLAVANPLVVNSHELAALARRQVNDLDHARAAAATLLGRGLPSLVVTLGELGALWFEGSSSGLVAAPHTTVVDTTGAGDAFVGNLAASLAAGSGLEAATSRAVIAASLSVQHSGTHASYPDRATVDAALAPS